MRSGSSNQSFAVRGELIYFLRCADSQGGQNASRAARRNESARSRAAHTEAMRCDWQTLALRALS